MRELLQACEITLDDMPPSLNNLYSTVYLDGKPRRVLSGEGRRWKESAALIIRTQCRIAGYSIMPRQLFALTITLQAPNYLQWDLDGKSKLLIDALCEALSIDDRYLTELKMTKRRGEENIRIHIEAL